jgi:choline dehydrogenase-like flavoprotein
VALARRIAASDPCRRAGVGVELDPGAADVVSHLRRTATTAYHVAGTCRLGSDPDAVVDPWLRVAGVEALRVVDASVMPATVAGNAQAAVLAIAERAADLIRARARSA